MTRRAFVPAPVQLNAEEITEALGVSRSNVSMGLKDVCRKYLRDDRRDFFQAPDDFWQIVRTLAEERRKREIDPTVSMLRVTLMKEPDSPRERHAQGRMREMHDLIELLVGWADDVQTLDNRSLTQLLTLGAGVSKLFRSRPRSAASSPTS